MYIIIVSFFNPLNHWKIERKVKHVPFKNMYKKNIINNKIMR